MTHYPRFTAPPNDILDTLMVNAFYRDGFLILDKFAAPEACDLLSQRVDELIAAFDPSSVQETFAAADKGAAADRYFRESGDKIRFFFAPGTFAEDGRLTGDKAAAVTSIGYALHDLDPLFDGFSRDPSLASVATGIGMAEPALIQSQVTIDQPPRAGAAEVALHQDASFLYTEPVSVVGFWFALDDIDKDSGCLVALAGQHRAGLRERFRYSGDALAMTQVNKVHWNYGNAVSLEAPKGTMILLHGLLPYYAGINRSGRPRRSYAFHAIDRTTRWSPDNWLRRPPSMPLVGFD